MIDDNKPPIKHQELLNALKALYWSQKRLMHNMPAIDSKTSHYNDGFIDALQAVADVAGISSEFMDTRQQYVRTYK